jgi:curved DNA-binding protein CbpA
MAVESPDLNGRTYYDILGLRGSTPLSLQEIKVAYHRALLTVHPDKVTGATGAQVDLVREAWRVLSDEALRKEYDSKLNSTL